MKKNYLISISPLSYTAKPQDSELGVILKNLVPREVTLSELAEMVTPPFSYSTAPTIFSGGTKNEHWNRQQSFFMDFDETLSVDEVIERLASFGITPNLIYYTFRHTDESPRFRVIMLVDEVIEDMEIAKYINKGMKLLFPESDQSTYKLSTVFFGGKESVILSEEPTPLKTLLEMAGVVIIENDGGKTRNVLGGVKLCNYNINTPRETENIPYLNYLRNLSNNAPDWQSMMQVRVFREFIEGRWLYHNELFGLATSLYWLRGGRALFKSTMEKHNKAGLTHYDKYKFRIIDYVAEQGYYPMKLENYSPYEEDWKWKTLVNAAKRKTKRIERIREKETISLVDAQLKFENAFQEALNANDNLIYIFKVPTGFGKTSALLNLKGVIQAYPTHKLKSEVAEKMAIPISNVPNLPTFRNPNINADIANYYAQGLHEKAYFYLQDIANRKSTLTAYEDSDAAKLYLSETDKEWDKATTLLTTHQRAIFRDDAPVIIYDEDPIHSILKTEDVNLNDLIALNFKLPDGSNIDSVIDFIINARKGDVNPTPQTDIDRNVLVRAAYKIESNTNTIEFLSSNGFYKKNDNQLSYVIHNALADNQKHMILSATPLTTLYEQLYPGRVKVIDLSNIQLKGRVLQSAYKTYSRTSLTDELITELNDYLGNTPVITFQKLKNKFNNPVQDMHYHNTLGYDSLNGVDCAIVGTPHYNDSVYRLLAFVAGINPNDEGQMKMQQVEYEGHRFSFMTFKNPQMQKIQLSMIESEIIQAVGRARALRNDVTVQLFSNFPLWFADFV